MATISGVRKDGGLNPRLHTPLIIFAVIALMVAALSLGVVAFVVITEHPEYQPAVEVATSTAATRVSTTYGATTTTCLQTTTLQRVQTTTTVNDGPSTTFRECSGPCLDSTTTTLPEASDDQSCNATGHTYRGPFHCPNKGSTAWFTGWGG